MTEKNDTPPVATDCEEVMRELREKTERLDLALRSAGMGSWSINLTDHRRYFDDMVCRLLGIDPATFTGSEDAFYRVVHPDDRERISAALKRTIEQGVPYEPEYRVLWPDGSVHCIAARAKLVRGHRGGSSEILGIIWDVTERKRLEREIVAAGEGRYKALFLSSRDAVMTLGPPAWKFTSANPATVAMFGAKNEKEFLAYEPWALSPKIQPDGRDSTEKAKSMIEQAMREGTNFFAWTHRRLDGKEFPAEVLLSRVELGRTTFLHAVVRDITERKKLEEKLRERAKELEIKVAERTRELAGQVKELELLNKTMVGRELKMVELKKEIKRLEKLAKHSA